MSWDSIEARCKAIVVDHSHTSGNSSVVNNVTIATPHMRHFEEAMTKIRPLSAQELDIYKRIAEQFGRPSPPPTQAPTSPSAIA
jgi:hypothetical protein